MAIAPSIERIRLRTLRRAQLRARLSVRAGIAAEQLAHLPATPVGRTAADTVPIASTGISGRRGGRPNGQIMTSPIQFANLLLRLI
jgi:hypothetical protein